MATKVSACGVAIPLLFDRLGIDPALGYNLVLPSLLAIIGCGAYSVASNLVAAAPDTAHGRASPRLPACRFWRMAPRPPLCRPQRSPPLGWPPRLQSGTVAGSPTLTRIESTINSDLENLIDLALSNFDDLLLEL